MFESIAKDIIKHHEGFSPVPYKCTAGKTTIGYGRNLDARPLSTNAADFLLGEDVTFFIDKAKNYEWFSKLDDVRKAVIVDMMFNMGSLTAFTNFRKQIEAGDYVKACDEMKASLWYSQVGRRALNDIQWMRTGSTNGVWK